MSQTILAIDEGTTGASAALFNADDLSLLGHSKIEFEQIYPNPGLVEHRPDDIWRATLNALKNTSAIVSKESAPLTMEAVGITNQRETVVAWNRKTGESIGNAIVWQDRRTADFCEDLKRNASTKEKVFRKTGLICDPYFSASKMRWVLKNRPEAAALAKKGELALGTVDSYLIYKLTGGKQFVTEHTNASRTMLYNLETGDYDDDLLSLFEIPRSCLPDILPSLGHFGVTLGMTEIKNGTPITGCLGDQQSALYGQNCDDVGEAKITFGTGAFLLMQIGNQPLFSEDGLLTTVSVGSRGERTFAFEGAAFIAGAAVQFLRDQFAWFDTAAETESLIQQDPRDPQVLFVPALSGLSAPYWNPYARGTLFGLTRGTSKSQITRAVLESIALQNAQLLRLMEKAGGTRLKRVGVDGGATANSALMQFQADILQTTLTRPGNIETTAKGAARAAKQSLAKNDAKVQFRENSTEFVPKMPSTDAEKIVTLWESAASAVDKFYRKKT